MQVCTQGKGGGPPRAWDRLPRRDYVVLRLRYSFETKTIHANDMKIFGHGKRPIVTSKTREEVRRRKSSHSVRCSWGRSVGSSKVVTTVTRNGRDELTLPRGS